MGGDGGVLPTGRKFIRGCGKSIEDKKEDGRNISKSQVLRTTICAQSCEPLMEPIIACEMGNLYSKESILKAFIDKALNPLFSHLRGMKDIKTLLLSPNPAYSLAKEMDGESRPKYICPITSMEFNGIHPFVVIWSTGFVISEKAIREIGIDGLQQEYGPFNTQDVVRLIPGDEELKEQRSHMESRRENMKNGKKDGKKTKRDRESDISNTTSSSSSSNKGGDESQKVEKSEKKLKASNNSASTNFGREKVSGSAVSLASATSLARKAAETIESQEAKSKIFKDLFHKGHEADKHDRDLFMSIAGLRYSVT
jgi:hypothetical protein